MEKNGLEFCLEPLHVWDYTLFVMFVLMALILFTNMCKDMNNNKNNNSNNLFAASGS